MNSENAYSNLKLYEGVRGLAVKILNRIDRTDAYLDKMLEIEIKNSDLKGNDKALLFEIVHGVIRYLGRIDWILNGFYKGQFSKCIPNIKNAMRVALYQILFLDRVPDYAAVNEAVDFVKKLQGKKPADLTNGVLRNIIRNKDKIRYPDKEEDFIGYLSAYHSHPSWLVKRWVNRFGEKKAEELLIANNAKPNLYLRVNSLLTNSSDFAHLLQKVQLRYSKGKYLPDFFRLHTLSNISDWEYFAKGFFSIQDESTGLSCYLLDIKPGQRVLDVCAAPGGKTGLLANLMNNEGELVALDKYESRLNILKRNMERLGVSNITFKEVDSSQYKDELFDRILLDAPCSGLGTLTKKPDIKWKRDLGDIRKLNELQLELLENSAKLLKVGGYLVYSTCTIEPEENIMVVNKFLENNPGYQLVSAEDKFEPVLIDENKCVQTLPNVHEIDGAFAARIIRIN